MTASFMSTRSRKRFGFDRAETLSPAESKSAGPDHNQSGVAGVALDGVSRRFGSSRGLDTVSIEIRAGEMFCLLGPSGCGKTTLLNLIAGVLQPDAGSILINGNDATHLSSQGRNIGYVFQSHALFPHMTVARNVEYGLRVRRASKAQCQQRVEECLSLVGLADRGGAYPRELSGGQRQRVAIARALAFEPGVLLLDEPMSSLDARLREGVRQEIKAIQERTGVTAILVTHDHADAFALADRVAILRDGRVRQIGTPSDLYERPRDTFVAEFMGSVNILHADKCDGAAHVGPWTIGPVPPPSAEGARPAACDVLLRPEQLIMVEASSVASPAQTMVRAVVTSVADEGSLQRVEVHVSALDRRLIVRCLAHSLGVRLEPGVQVYCSYGREQVHVLPCECGEAAHGQLD